MAPITMYTRSWCPYCTAAKRLLRGKGLSFTDIDIEAQSGADVAAALRLSVAAVYRARSRVVARLKELVQSAQEP